ncbi:FBP domain-containing protein [Streptomyces sp. NBC_01465]|uniref:FBP domain-containing protein n=1 Tax=Streptomyces sp. NBC_01465 TaxID=2903878 RepID=UPI002E2F50B4|nr:FBP domain-containing protein [Streptomyces sp. NBC_01465]
MRPVSEQEIRASFVNCSKGEAKRLSVPYELDGLPWGDLDFLGWRDQSAPERSYLVVERDGRLTGVALRHPARQGGNFTQRSMCSLCLTTHPRSGVLLMTAPKAGAAGRDGNSVGIYVCADLACSLYVRGKKELPPRARFDETLTLDEQVERLLGKLYGYLDLLMA